MKAHNARGAITPVQMTTVLGQIMAADNPEELLGFQDEIFAMLPDGDDPDNPGATARKAKGSGKAPRVPRVAKATRRRRGLSRSPTTSTSRQARK